MSPLEAALLLFPTCVISTSSFAQQQCAIDTLKGQYVFTGRGFIEKLDPGVQRMLLPPARRLGRISDDRLLAY
jgi:hypothetical protein